MGHLWGEGFDCLASLGEFINLIDTSQAVGEVRFTNLDNAFFK